MKPHFFKKICAALLLLAGALGQAQAAIITSYFSDLGNNHWTVNLALKNDSVVAGINEFSVYFSQSYFSDLTVLASPASWDSFVAQPDPALGAPGFFDSYNLNALAMGDTLAGFKVGFTFLGQGMPDTLGFDIIGSDFQPISSGTSTIVTNAVPEPSSALLMLAGCMLFAFNRKARQGAAA